MLQFPTATPPLRADSLPDIHVAVNPQQLVDNIVADVDAAQKTLDSDATDHQLKQALSRMISRVQELSTQLAAAFKTQSELETHLTLAKSNLQLSLANTEMLEEALKRDHPDHGKDVGWRRWSSQRRSEEQSRDPAQPPLPNGTRTDSLSSSEAAKSPMTPGVPSMSPPLPSTTPDSRFFKFRLRGPSRSPSLSRQPRSTEPSAHNSPTSAIGLSTAHLTSASLPSLVLDQETEAAKREAELAGLLDEERKKYQNLAGEKATLEAELESLSQALFEEANKMVATERIKFAEADEELRSTVAEKEALRSALKLIERENDRLRRSVLEVLEKAENETLGQTSLATMSHGSIDRALSMIMKSLAEGELLEEENAQSAAGCDYDPDTTLKSAESELPSNKSEETIVLPSEPAAPASTSHSPAPRVSSTSDVDNPWSSLLRRDSSPGIVTYLG